MQGGVSGHKAAMEGGEVREAGNVGNGQGVWMTSGTMPAVVLLLSPGSADSSSGDEEDDQQEGREAGREGNCADTGGECRAGGRAGSSGQGDAGHEAAVASRDGGNRD